MYASFYNLKKEAFHITPDPEFLFLSPSHKEALASIVYGVQRKKGFVSITGEVGVGKTTILRSYLEQVDSSKLKIIYIFNSNVSFLGLLKTICQELDKKPVSDSDFELVNQLHEILIEEYKKGFNVVLIIDEAQNMPVKTLENLRMLSNLETSTDKLIQIVFGGQPEFERMLGMEELRQLRQRVAVKAIIQPLTAEESRAYIRHRLAVSAGNLSIFTDAALKKIIREARGIPRVINILCENAFITALGYQKKKINKQIVGEVIADFAGGKKNRGFRFAVVFLSILLVLFISLLAYLYNYKRTVVSTPVKRQSTALSVQNDSATVNISDNSVKKPPATTGDDNLDSTGKKAESTASEKLPLEVNVLKGSEKLPVEVTVRKGDTLSSLAWRVYGFSSKELIMLVKNRNNSIYDADIISVGQHIVFPAREKRSGKTHE